MAYLEQHYEKHFLQQLPPNARDIAEYLFSDKPLVFFIQQWHEPNADAKLLAEKNVAKSLWPDIIQAALIAKLTNVEPSDRLNKEQLLFLIHTVCQLVDMPLSQYTLDEVRQAQQEMSPKLAHWLLQMARQLRNLSS